MKAADKLFGDVGYDAATTREIAELSGVNKALIHYHFKSKEALFENVLDWYYENLGNALKKALKSDVTTVIDVPIPCEENVFPMVAPGQSLKEIQLE